MPCVVKVGHVVDHRSRVGRARRRRAARSSCGELVAARAPTGHEVVLVCSGAIAAGLPALGHRPTRPTDIGTLQADRRGRPAPADGADRRDPRPRTACVAGPGAAHAARLRHAHAVPARARDAARACSTSASCRSSTRTTPSPTTRSATATTTASPRSSSHLVARRPARAAHRHRRAVHRRSPPRRRGVAHRGDRRGRRRARGRSPAAPGTDAGERRAWPRKLAAAKIAAWSGVRAVIAARRRARRGDRRHRRARRSAPSSRPAAERLSSRKLWIAFARGAAGRVVVDDGARRALVPTAPLAAAGRGAGRRGRVRRRRRGRDRRRRRRCRSPRAWSGTPRRCCGRVAGRQTSELDDGLPHEVVHRDDLVVLP